MSQKLSSLKGLGPKSEKALNEISIFTKADLKAIGPIQAFIKLGAQGKSKPGLNFLYAMVGALEDVHWSKVAKNEKGRLLVELEAYKELQAILSQQHQTTK